MFHSWTTHSGTNSHIALMCHKEARQTNDLNARPIELKASALHAELNTLRVNESFSFEAPIIVFLACAVFKITHL